jgi:hypothetical protein
MEGLKSQMPAQNPLNAAAQMVQSVVAGDGRMTHFQSANEGPVSAEGVIIIYSC